MLTIGLWIIPLLLSLFFLGMMLRPYQQRGDFDFGAVFRLFWIIPVLLVWVIFLGILAAAG